MLHIALFFCALGFSLLFWAIIGMCLGCKSRDSQRRRPLVDQLALYLTYVGLLPNYQEDEAMLRGILEDAGRYPFAEKHTRIEFTLEVRILKTKLSMSWWRVTISSRTRGQPIIHLALLTRVFWQLLRKHGADLTGANSAVSSCLSAMLIHFGILSSSVPSLASLGIYTRDGQWQGDVRKGMLSEPVRRKQFLMVLTMVIPS